MVKYSNISVLLTHKFMEAVENDEDFDLKYDGEVYQTLKAKDLWNKIDKDLEIVEKNIHFNFVIYSGWNGW